MRVSYKKPSPLWGILRIMPCIKCKNGKYRLGSGKCVFTSKSTCERAYRAYRAKKYSSKKNRKILK